MSELALKALEIAKTQLGRHEDPLGSNWGHPVQDYLESVGINFPASWCAAFVYWCFKTAVGNNSLLIPPPKTAGVLDMWRKGIYFNKVDGDPQPGDIFIMDFGKGLGHCGIVEKVDENFIYTIDGNTNDSGSREGIEVCRKQRPRNKILGYLRY